MQSVLPIKAAKNSFMTDCLQPISSVITQDVWPKNIDALLTLIFKVGLGACHYHLANKGGKYIDYV